MNLKESTALVILAVSNFPNMQEKDMTPTAKLWEKMLTDIPYPLAEKVLLQVLSTAKFFPTVAEIREAAAEILYPIKSTAEAWGEVTAVIKQGRDRYTALRDNLSSISQKVCKTIGWWELYSLPSDQLERQFRRLYEELAQDERKKSLLPGYVSQLVAKKAPEMVTGNAN